MLTISEMQGFQFTRTVLPIPQSFPHLHPIMPRQKISLSIDIFIYISGLKWTGRGPEKDARWWKKTITKSLVPAIISPTLLLWCKLEKMPRSEIIRVISKSNERAARVRFEITSMIWDQNCIATKFNYHFITPILKSQSFIVNITFYFCFFISILMGKERMRFRAKNEAI